MKRIVVLVLSVILALSVAAPIVFAQGQGGRPQPDEGTFNLDAGAACSFPVRIEVSGQKKEIALPGGARIFTAFPAEFATVTNLSTGKQETFNITGSTHQTTLENGNVETVLTGRNIALDPVAGFVLAIGQFSFVFDKNGNLVQPLAGEGQLIDICKALA